MSITKEQALEALSILETDDYHDSVETLRRYIAQQASHADLRAVGFDMRDDFDRPSESCDCEKCVAFYKRCPPVGTAGGEGL